jgi:hypothetical protein
VTALNKPNSKIFIGNIQIKALIPSISKFPNVIDGRLIMLLFNGCEMSQSKLDIAIIKVFMKLLF